MANPDVSMDTQAVRGLSKNFATISNILRTVSSTLQRLIMILKVTAFVGLVGGAAVLQYMEMIKPQVDQLAEKCDELSKDLTAAVNAYEREDKEGATRFH